MRVYVREEYCVGCGLCQVYCATQHSAHPLSILKAYTLEEERPVPRVRVERKGLAAFAWQCQHCEDAPCISACITGAMSKNEAGVVLVDESRCIGCSTCVVACPNGAIVQADQRKHVVLKCDLCFSGEAIPICVQKCPNEALLYEGGQSK